MATIDTMHAMQKRSAVREPEGVSRTKMMLDSNMSLDDLDLFLDSVKPAPALAAHLTGLLAARDMSNEELGNSANIGRSTVYKIMDGRQRPEQDMLLRMAFALELTAEETQQLLKAGHRAQLTASRRRDVAIIFGLQNELTLDEMDGVLMEKNMEPLTPPAKKLSEELKPFMKDISVSELITDTQLDPQEVAAALKKAGPGAPLEALDLLADSLEKDDLLRIGYQLQVTTNAMQHLLRIAHRAFLNRTDARDQELLAGLAAGLTLDEINAILNQNGMKQL